MACVADDSFLFYRASYHPRSDLLHIGFLLVHMLDDKAIPHDHDGVTDIYDLLKAVGDEDDCNTCFRKHPHRLEEGNRLML